MVELYYANAPEISQILKNDRKLKNELRNLIIKNICVAEKLLRTGQASVDQKVIDKIISFLTLLKPKASPRLTSDIDLLLWGIKNGRYLNAIGVNIAQ